MHITYQKRRLEKVFNSEATLRQTHGERMAKTIMRRMQTLGAAHNLASVPTTPPERRHQLTGDRHGQFAVDLVQPYRLVFVPHHDPIPLREGGGIDTEQVTAITILEVVDYHR